MTEARGQLENTELLEAVIRGLTKTQLTEKTECCIVLGVCGITISLQLNCSCEL